MTTTTRTRAGFAPDALDNKLFAAFPGLVMRKDLTQAIRGTSKAPSYVIEFMLSKYCANLFDDQEVYDGLQIVQQEVAEYIPRGDETEVIKSTIRERPPRRLIDLVKVELDEKIDEGIYWASLITANIDRVRISSEIVTKYDRLLMAGAWCNLRVDYDDTFKIGKRTFPFVVQRLEPVMSAWKSIWLVAHSFPVTNGSTASFARWAMNRRTQRSPSASSSSTSRG